MTEREHLLEALNRDHWIINQQAKDLTHEESVLQLPFRGNCFNWILGHIVVYRDKMAAILEIEPALSSAEAEPYGRGSDPIVDADSAIPLERLLAAADQVQQRLLKTLEVVPNSLLETVYDPERGHTVLDRFVFLVWHETYHVGQLEILRQLAGKDDAII
jgi:uncharacterized damage-inducible protein DinB